MPAATAKGYPYPLTSDPFLPASVDFPALAAAIEAKSAREVAAVLSAATVGEVGMLGQVRAGRELLAADFTTLLGLSAPVGLWDAGSLTNLGSGGNLTNKGAVPLTAKGLAGTANHAALFAGSTGQALYIADVGAGDPFRIKTGTFGCWFRTGKRGTSQVLVSKDGGSSPTRGWYVGIDSSTNAVFALCSATGTTTTTPTGTTDVCDDRWHFACVTFDGTTIRVYVDGALEASASLAGTVFGTTAPFNIGGLAADGSTAATSPHFGRIAVPFVTPDVLSEDQVRLLMALKVAHGYAVTPTRVHVTMRHKRRGAALATGDFPVTPKLLYPFTAGSFTSIGSNGLVLAGGGSVVAGADGVAAGGWHFKSADAAPLFGADAGLPTTTGPRSYGCWFKTTATGDMVVLGWGTVTSNDSFLEINAGVLGCPNVTGNVVNDGAWHFGVVTVDNAAADGLKTKLYCDGRLVGSSTSIRSLTLSGGGGFHIGSRADASLLFDGTVDDVFVCDYALAADEIAALFAKGSAATPSKPGDDPLEQIVQGYDATNVYLLGDVRKRIAGRVLGDGSVAGAVGGEFRVARSATGTYEVFFPVGMFTSPPAVTLEGGSGVVGATTAQSFAVTTGGVDAAFRFAVEGRGPLDSQNALDLRVAA